MAICDELVDTTKTISTKSTSATFLHFTSLCINHHCIIDKCKYLPDKILRKIKTFITISQQQEIKKIYIKDILEKWKMMMN